MPDHKIFKKVFLAGVDDPNVDLTLLRDNMRAPSFWSDHCEPPVLVERLKKRVVDPDNNNNVSNVDIKAVVTTFGNFLLPPFVHILGKRIYFNPFVQRVIRCIHL